jgi:NAD-dependent oxidoreductase involved in siderophore biosynthesis
MLRFINGLRLIAGQHVVVKTMFPHRHVIARFLVAGRQTQRTRS